MEEAFGGVAWGVRGTHRPILVVFVGVDWVSGVGVWRFGRCSRSEPRGVDTRMGCYESTRIGSFCCVAGVILYRLF